MAGRYPQALTFLDRAFGEKAELGDRWGLSYTYLERARIRLDLGELECAETAADAGLAIALEVRDPKLTSAMYAVKASVCIAKQQLEAASLALQQGVFEARACGALVELAVAQERQARVHGAHQRWALARKVALHSLTISERVGAHQQAALARIALAAVELGQSRYQQAEVQLAAAAVDLRSVTNPYRQLDLMSAQLDLSLARGELATACQQASSIRSQAISLNASRHRERANQILARHQPSNS